MKLEQLEQVTLNESHLIELTTFISGVVSGITIIAFIFNLEAARATPCAWLPAEAAITPIARCDSVK